MSRKILLSFLGTGSYKPCVYFSEELGESTVVEYIQDAICQLACNDFGEHDAAYFFLTEAAENRHWQKLKSSLGHFKGEIVPVSDMPQGTSEAEIWQIFDKVFGVIQEGDQVVLDITHGFRTFPMLVMVLINYAKSIKRISTKAIYYGAFESLGHPGLIDEKYPDPKDRKVPILELSIFTTLQDWAYASENFSKTGNPNEISGLVSDHLKAILAESTGKDQIAFSIRKLVNSIKKGEREISTNRGALISAGYHFAHAKEELAKLLASEQLVFNVFKPLLLIIEQKINMFSSRDVSNWEASIRWCINHGLIQQGITQLQEGLITLICDKYSLDKSNVSDRELISQCWSQLIYPKEESKWRSPAADNKELVRTICADDFLLSRYPSYGRLMELRNDINHGGYKKDSLSDPKLFESRLEKLFFELMPQEQRTTTARRQVLLNFSNHPSASWGAQQKSVAVERYHDIIDLPFPHIDPATDADALDELSDRYLKEITQINPSAIHIMGELTFTFRMVNGLKAAGYVCIASTTERIAADDGHGNKVSSFRFTGFREY